MNAFKRASLAVLLLALYALPAHAGWHQRELRWFKSSIRSASDASLYVRDTAFNVLGGTATLSGAILDTTMTFSPTDGTPFIIGHTQATVEASPRRDSLAVGYLVFMTDSSVVQTGGLSSLQIILDGRPVSPTAGGSASAAAGWSQVDSLSVGAAVGAPSFSIPIPLALTGRMAGMLDQQITAFENVRARASAGVGALPAARVFWRYWTPEFEEQSPR